MIKPIYLLTYLVSLSLLSAEVPSCYEKILHSLLKEEGKVKFYKLDPPSKGSLKDLIISHLKGNEEDAIKATARSLDDNKIYEAQLLYSLKGKSELHIEDVNIDRQIRGNGLQTIMMKYMIQQNPNVKKIRSSLADDNETYFFKSLITKLNIKIDIPDEVSSDFFFDCCLETFQKLSPDVKTDYLEKSFKKTPAYNSRKSLGFTKKCPNERLVDFDIYKDEKMVIPVIVSCR